MNSRMSLGLWGLGAFFSVGVAGYALYFVPTGGSPAPQILENLYAKPWLMTHAGFAGLALLVGPFQFLPAIRRRRDIHRLLGRTYAISCVLGGAAGLALSFGSTSGPIAGVGFGLLAVVWLYSTIEAWRMARMRRFDEHRAWMIRSFALTFAAVTLRLYMPTSAILGLDPLAAYRAIAWLAWVPNLAVAEIYIRSGTRSRTQPV